MKGARRRRACRCVLPDSLAQCATCVQIEDVMEAYSADVAWGAPQLENGWACLVGRRLEGN